jgi:hypothetical protein
VKLEAIILTGDNYIGNLVILGERTAGGYTAV